MNGEKTTFSRKEKTNKTLTQIHPDKYSKTPAIMYNEHVWTQKLNVFAVSIVRCFVYEHSFIRILIITVFTMSVVKLDTLFFQRSRHNDYARFQQKNVT